MSLIVIICGLVGGVMGNFIGGLVKKPKSLPATRLPVDTQKVIAIPDFQKLSFYGKPVVHDRMGLEVKLISIGASGIMVRGKYDKRPCTNHFWPDAVDVASNHWSFTWEEMFYVFPHYAHEIRMLGNPAYAEQFKLQTQLRSEMDELGLS